MFFARPAVAFQAGLSRLAGPTVIPVSGIPRSGIEGLSARLGCVYAKRAVLGAVGQHCE